MARSLTRLVFLVDMTEPPKDPVARAARKMHGHRKASYDIQNNRFISGSHGCFRRPNHNAFADACIQADFIALAERRYRSPVKVTVKSERNHESDENIRHLTEGYARAAIRLQETLSDIHAPLTAINSAIAVFKEDMRAVDKRMSDLNRESDEAASDA